MYRALTSEGELDSLIASSYSSYIPASAFEHESGQITQISLTTSNKTVGAEQGNTATITFTPDTSLPAQEGAVEITTPYISKFYDDSDYPTSASNFACSSSQFASTSQTVADGLLLISYLGYLGEEGDEVSITCDNWQNPNAPEAQYGYGLRTLSRTGAQVDHAEDFMIDASEYESVELETAGVTVELSVPFANEASSYTVSFESPVDLKDDQSCYVRYQFPEEIDVSNLDIGSIQGRGMFTGSTDDEALTVTDSDLVGEPKYVVLEGCNFESS